MIVRSDTPEMYRPRQKEDIASSGFWSPLRRWYLPCKGVADCLVALTLLILASPLLLLAALLVKLTSSGSAFYSQTRIGKHGRPFAIYKLRTMYDNCESASGPRWSTPGDARITPLGRVLRRAHVDELPQLWNVMRGDMALIGPRPERPEFIPNLTQALPHYADRLLLRPGMSGLAQVQLPPDTDLGSVRRKLAYDLYYVRHVSLWLDLRILTSTFLYLLRLPVHMLPQLGILPRRHVVEETYRSATGQVITVAAVQPA
ncbi:MAG TPA: sugar transferase [Gemmataceae bacterium]|nr:sugar transferase [Gemmataceae bacterium]